MMPQRTVLLLLVWSFSTVHSFHQMEPRRLPRLTTTAGRNDGPQQGQMTIISAPLHSSKNDNDDNNNSSKNSKPKGVYVRPSAAVERGSGFFFPGLEGAKVRIFVGIVLLVATAVNHAVSSETSAFSEAIAVVYSLLVLLQGAIEQSKEGRIETIARREQSDSESGGGSRQLSQQWSSLSLEEEESWRNNVEWAATSFLSLTTATHMILVRQQEGEATPIVDYWLGVTPLPANKEDLLKGAATALETIQASKGGRVALPSDHPAAQLLMDEETYRRCIILQRIDENSCWMVASDDLLASFRKEDLQMLGRLGEYVDIEKQY